MRVKINIELPTWMEMLILLKAGLSMQKIGLYQKKTYAHVHNLITTLVEKGWVTRLGKTGRVVDYELTPKGNLIVSRLTSFVNVVKDELDIPLYGIKEYEEREYATKRND